VAWKVALPPLNMGSNTACQFLEENEIPQRIVLFRPEDRHAEMFRRRAKDGRDLNDLKFLLPL
jgi:hypothetical protein